MATNRQNIITNKQLSKMIINMTNVDRNESKGITQIYINGNPIIDDWHGAAKIAIEYYAESDDDKANN